MFTEHAGIWCSGGSREIFRKTIFLCLYCRIAAKNKFKYVGETIQSLNIHRWLIKLRNRETTLNRCVNKTCVGFFHFDIVITISAIVNPLFEHGGSWQRWGFDSQFFCIFMFLYFCIFVFLYLYFYIFHLCICTCNCVHTNCSST